MEGPLVYGAAKGDLGTSPRESQHQHKVIGSFDLVFLINRLLERNAAASASSCRPSGNPIL